MSSSDAHDVPGGQVDARVDVLILGASLLGVELVWRLRRSRVGRTLKLGVVDRQARHAYIPLIQERLTDRIGPDESMLDTHAYVTSVRDDQFFEGEVIALDPVTKIVTLADGRRLWGRHVVVALGSRVTPPSWLAGGPEALSLKFGAQLDLVRARVHALRDAGADAPRRVVVVGGGISGVELAGELAVLRARDPEPRLEVTLVHGGERLLPHLTPRAGLRAADILESQGVDLRTRTRLVGVHAEGIRLEDRTAGDSEPLEMETELVLWAGGLEPAEALGQLGLPRTDDGWLRVGPTLQAFPLADGGSPDIFAGGDAVRIFGGAGQWETMQRAIEAIWQAKSLARNLVRSARWRRSASGDPAADGERPPLRPHATWRDFAHGVSLGERSLVVWGPLVVDLGAFNVRFRRWLMRQYVARYAAR